MSRGGRPVPQVRNMYGYVPSLVRFCFVPRTIMSVPRPYLGRTSAVPRPYIRRTSAVPRTVMYGYVRIYVRIYVRYAAIRYTESAYILILMKIIFMIILLILQSTFVPWKFV